MINGGEHKTLERHEMVNWFNQVDDTYRGQLRELNELNFARFDAKLEQRMTQLEATLEQRVTQVEARLEQRLAEVKAALHQDVARLEAALRQEIGEIRVEIGAQRGDFQARLEVQSRMLIKWMFGFWITTVTTLGGLVVAVLHFLPAARP